MNFATSIHIMIKWPQFFVALALGSVLTVLTIPSTQGTEVQIYKSHGVFAMELPHGAPTPLIVIEPGDTLKFSNGKSFTVHRVLGGDSNHIIDIGGGKILRVPRYPQEWFRLSLKNYVMGYGALKEQGVPTPEIYFEESDVDEYLVQNYLPIQFTLLELRQQSGEVQNKAHLALREFARQTAAFELIGDIFPWQMGWDGTRWILLDWTSTHILHDFEPWSAPTTFWERFEPSLSLDEIRELRGLVIMERNQRRALLCDAHLKK